MVRLVSTLITLLRIPYLGRIGSTKLELPKWHMYGKTFALKITRHTLYLPTVCSMKILNVIPENQNTPLEFIVTHLQRNFQVVSLLHKLLHKFQLFY